MSKDRTTSGYMVLIFRAIHVLQWHSQNLESPYNKDNQIVKKVSQFGLVAVTRCHEVGFGSNLRVEREGEFSNSVRINRPSPLEISPFSEKYFNFKSYITKP